jgi:hypothetical protein
MSENRRLMRISEPKEEEAKRRMTEITLQKMRNFLHYTVHHRPYHYV